MTRLGWKGEETDKNQSSRAHTNTAVDCTHLGTNGALCTSLGEHCRAKQRAENQTAQCIHSAPPTQHGQGANSQGVTAPRSMSSAKSL